MVPSGHPTPRLCAGVPIVEASPPPLPDTHEFQLPQAALSQPGARGPQVHVRAGSRHTANGTWGPSPLVSLRLGSLWLPQAWGWGGQCAVCLEGDWPRVMGMLLEPRAGEVDGVGRLVVSACVYPARRAFWQAASGGCVTHLRLGPSVL